MFKFLVPALAAGFLCLPALAGTVFIQHTFDLGLADTVTPTQLRYSSDEFAPLTIHQGDTVELDYSFLPGQAVSMASGGSIPLVMALHQAVPTAELLLFGATDGYSNIHAPNERVIADEYERATAAIAGFLGRYAETSR